MNPLGTFGRDISEIAAALISVALVALLVSHASGVKTIVESVGGTFGGLLNTVTLQNSYGNVFGGG